MKKLIIFSCWCFLFSASSFAQEGDARFSVEVSSDTVLFGNYIRVVFQLENADGAQFEPPAFKGFEIVGGPNQSTSMSIVNGTMSRSASYTYFLKPSEMGIFYVEPAFIDAEGKQLATEPVEIFVLENPDGIIESPQAAPSPFDRSPFFDNDFFNFPKRNFPQEKTKKHPTKMLPKRRKRKNERFIKI